MMRAYRAARILTMDAQRSVVEDGGIVVENGRILAVGPWKEVGGGGACHDLGSVTLVPGLINAHAHLELSHLAGRIPAGQGFAAWADGLFGAMKSVRPNPPDVEHAVRSMQASGTRFVADVTGREAVMVRRALDACGVCGHLFQEFSGRARSLGLQPDGMPGPWSPAVHALYSTDPVLARDVKGWCSARGLPFSLHLAEVPGENELFLHGGGDFAGFLRSRRILPKSFAPSGMSAVACAGALGLLDSRTLAVHCVHVDSRDIGQLAASGASVCLCPRSNAWIGVGAAPARALHAAGVPLCLGTDSLASNADLDLWEELRAVRTLLGDHTSLADLLAMVTLNPAKVLGIEAEFGCLAPGRRAAWAFLPADFDPSASAPGVSRDCAR